MVSTLGVRAGLLEYHECLASVRCFCYRMQDKRKQKATIKQKVNNTMYKNRNRNKFVRIFDISIESFVKLSFLGIAFLVK